MSSSTTWQDAFPWLPSKARSARGSDDAWWERTVAGDSVGEQEEAFATIALLAVDRLLKWPIGEIFPHLPADLAVDDLDLSVRARNVLGNAGWTETGDLHEVVLADVLGRRNAGIGTIDVLLRALAAVSTVPSGAQDAEVIAIVSGSAPPQPGTEWIAPHIRDLRIVAEWNGALGLTARSPFEPLQGGAPAPVVAAHGRLHALSTDDVLAGAPVPGVADLLDIELFALEERSRQILEERLFADQPRTLDELGKKLDITRERVRQLESKARTRLDAAIEGEGVLAEVAATVRNHARGGVRPLADLLAQVPALSQTVSSVGFPAWRVLDRLDDSYEIEGGWCVEPTMAAARAETSAYLEDLADRYGVVRLDDESGASATGVLPWLADWLAHCGYDITRGHVLLRTQAVGDEAAALLSIEGAPLTAGEIHQALVNPRALTSLQNAMGADARFQKVDRATWALAEWGLDEYGSIRDEIGKILDAREVPVPIAEVIAAVSGAFSVAESSVLAYASAPPYRIRDGLVERRGKAAVARREPAQTRRYFRHGDAWLVRVSITNDHLRGSGWPGQSALAVLAGIHSGERVELPSRLGPQLISWKGMQPAFGTIRRFLLADDIAAGDEVFAAFLPDGSFDVRRAPDAPSAPLAQALRLVGADPTLEGSEATAALAAAVEASGQGIGELVALYRARGDQDVAELLEQVAE